MTRAPAHAAGRRRDRRAVRGVRSGRDRRRRDRAAAHARAHRSRRAARPLPPPRHPRAAARARDHRARRAGSTRASSRRRPRRSAEHGLTFEHSTAWLAPEPTPTARAAPRPRASVGASRRPKDDGALSRRAHVDRRSAAREDRGPDRQEAGVVEHRDRARARSPHAVGRAVHARRQLRSDRSPATTGCAPRIATRTRREGRRAAHRSARSSTRRSIAIRSTSSRCSARPASSSASRTSSRRRCACQSQTGLPLVPQTSRLEPAHVSRARSGARSTRP